MSSFSEDSLRFLLLISYFLWFQRSVTPEAEQDGKQNEKGLNGLKKNLSDISRENLNKAPPVCQKITGEPKKESTDHDKQHNKKVRFSYSTIIERSLD